MKHLMLIAGLAVLVIGVGVMAQQKEMGAEQELIALEKEWGGAYMKQDTSVLDRVDAADIVMTDSDGNMFTKADDLAEVKAGVYTVVSLVIEEIKAHLYGDTAVVYGATGTKGTYKGKAFDNRSRWTDTWIKRDGRWQCIASQATRISGDLGAAKEQVDAVLDQWDRVSETGDMGLFAKLVANDPDMVNFGTDAAERFVGYDAIAGSMRKFFGAAEGTQVTTRDRAIKVNDSGDLAWFAEIWDQSGRSQGEAYDIKGSRITGVLQKRNGSWMFVQIHASVPVSGQAIKY